MILGYLYEKCFDYFMDDTYFPREESFHAHTSKIFTNVMLMLLVSVRENLFQVLLCSSLGARVIVYWSYLGLSGNFWAL